MSDPLSDPLSNEAELPKQPVETVVSAPSAEFASLAVEEEVVENEESVVVVGEKGGKETDDTSTAATHHPRDGSSSSDSSSVDPNVLLNAASSKEKLAPCCATDKAFRALEYRDFFPLVDPLVQPNAGKPPVIYISEAIKMSEAGGSTFIAYVIRSEKSGLGLNILAKRRYSEFEALQKLLSRLYPSVCVPPIPEKHKMKEYAIKQSKAKEDVQVIEKRKRMLKTFLNRVAAHPILGKNHVFHQFLEGPITWNEILSTSGLTYLFKKSSSDGLGSSVGKSLKNADPHFLASEDFTFRFSHQISLTHKIQKKINKDTSEISTILSELGSNFNGWSLVETHLASTVEKVGEAIDNTVAATSSLSAAMEERVTEPLQEYSQLSKIVEKVLRYRDRKQEELQGYSDSLEEKQSALTKFEASEAESQRISAVLNAEGNTRPPSLPVDTSALPVTASKSLGMMATLNSLIDNDPETSRRNKISRTKDRIVTLRDQIKRASSELEQVNKDVQTDLDRFQRDKISDLRNMFMAFAIAQRDYHQKSLAAWKEAQTEVIKKKGAVVTV